MSWPQTVLKWLQLKPRFLFGIAVCCFLLALLPVGVLQWAKLTALMDSARGWLFVIGSVSSVFFCVQLLPKAGELVRRVKRRRGIVRHLGALSHEEAVLLAYCLKRNRQTLILSLDSLGANVASGLSQKGLLHVGTGIQNVLAVPHTIDDGAWRELRKRESAIVQQAAKGLGDARLKEAFRHLDAAASGRDGSLTRTQW